MQVCFEPIHLSRTRVSVKPVKFTHLYTTQRVKISPHHRRWPSAAPSFRCPDNVCLLPAATESARAWPSWLDRRRVEKTQIQAESRTGCGCSPGICGISKRVTARACSWDAPSYGTPVSLHRSKLNHINMYGCEVCSGGQSSRHPYSSGSTTLNFDW